MSLWTLGVAKRRAQTDPVSPHPTLVLPHLKLDSNSLNSDNGLESIGECIDYKALI